MQIIDQTKIYENYKGQWVILDQGGTEVLASDKKLVKAISKYYHKFGTKKVPLTFKVPTEIMPYIGC